MKTNDSFKIGLWILLLSFFTFQIIAYAGAAALETVSLIKPVKTTDSQNQTTSLSPAPVVSDSQDSISFLQQSAVLGPSGSLALAAAVPNPPVITSTVPPFTNKSTLVISGTKQKNTSILINGIEVVASSKSTTWSASLQMIGQGVNSFSITAKDTLGQQSTPLTVKVIYDTIAPILSTGINHHFPFDDGLGVYTTSREATLYFVAVDYNTSAVSGLDEYRVSTVGPNQGTWTKNAGSFSEQSLPITFTSAGDGTKTVYMEARDKAGNVQKTSSSIILDTTPPVGSFSLNNGAASTTNPSVTLAWNASDATSGVDTVSYSVDQGQNWISLNNLSSPSLISLPPGDGPKEVRYQIVDKAGLGTVLTASIQLITQTSPILPSPLPPSQISNVGLGTSVSNVSLNPLGFDQTASKILVTERGVQITYDTNQPASAPQGFAGGGFQFNDGVNLSQLSSFVFGFSAGHTPVKLEFKDFAGRAIHFQLANVTSQEQVFAISNQNFLDAIAVQFPGFDLTRVSSIMAVVEGPAKQGVLTFNRLQPVTNQLYASPTLGPSQVTDFGTGLKTSINLGNPPLANQTVLTPKSFWVNYDTDKTGLGFAGTGVTFPATVDLSTSINANNYLAIGVKSSHAPVKLEIKDNSGHTATVYLMDPVPGEEKVFVISKSFLLASGIDITHIYQIVAVINGPSKQGTLEVFFRP